MAQTVHKQRVFSAKPTFLQTPTRPLSGMPSQTFSRKQLIQNIYTVQSQLLPLRSASAKGIGRVQVDLQRSKKIVVKQSRKKEELEEQILKLKRTINGLTDQLCQQKGKTESMRKKGNQFSKILSIEFENERHWNSSALNSHLVTGIKNSYDCLKEKYEALQQEHSLILRRQTITKELQYITYIDTLEKENQNLAHRLSKVTQSTVGGHERDVANFIIGELQVGCESIGEKYKQLEGRYRMCGQTLKDRNKKIQFLEKIIIEKDNTLHHAQRQARKWQEDSTNQRKTNQALQNNLKQQFHTHEQYVNHLQGRLIDIQEYYERMISEELKGKEGRIAQMEKENNYLKDMISQLRKTNTQLNQMLQADRTKSIVSNQLFLPQIKKEVNLPLVKAHNTQGEINYIGERYMTVHQNANKNESFSGLFVNGKRIPQKADIKYHEDAQKKRRMNVQQVSELVQLTRLKLINSNFPFARIKTLFDVDSNSRKGEWEQEYITMRQVKQILTFPPFSLTNERAQLLARYLIEDVQTEFVYSDDFNENTREIVKSILKALLKEYPVCMPNSHLESDVKKFMQNYEVNLKSALSKIEPLGLISKRKFLQTLNNLGMDCSEDVQCILLGKMAEKASSINQLNYRALFN